MPGFPFLITVGTALEGGAAVFAFELGLADSAVQLLGDWSSAAFKNYLEFAFVRKANIARLLASNFDKQLEEN